MRIALKAVLSLLLVFSAGAPVAALQTEGLCAEVIVPQMQQTGLDVSQFATILGCEQNSNLWIQRTVSQSQTVRWPVTLDSVGMSLMRDVDDLSVNEGFAYSVRFDRSTSEIVTVGAGGVLNRTDIADRLVSTGPNWLNNYVDAYAADMETYLMNTAGEKPELVEYLYWFTSRRDAVLQSMSYAANPPAGTAFLANWGYMQWPWPWQLADPVAIASFVSETAASVVPTQGTVPASEETVMGGVFVHSCAETWCEGVEGVTISYETADGKHAGSCITTLMDMPSGTTGYCAFPVTIGVDYTVTLDVSTLPPGVSLSGPTSLIGHRSSNPEGPESPPTFLVDRT